MTTNIVSDYIGVEISSLDSVSEDDVSATYIIDTEHLKDIFNTQLSNICLNPTMARNDEVYSSYTDQIFCLIVEVSLFMISNYIHDIPSVVNVVLGELYEDRTHVGDLIITSKDIRKDELMCELIEPIYKGIEKQLSLLSEKADDTYLVPVNWSCPNYKYLAIGEFHD